MNARIPVLLLLLAALLCPTVRAAGELPVVSVAKRPVGQGFSAESVVEAVHQTTVGARVPGRVLDVLVDAGRSVRKGDTLMRLDAREAAEMARAAEAQYRVASTNYERQRQLKEQKFVSQAALDRARAEFDAAAAKWAAAGVSQSHALIVAPIDGIVARRHAEVGDMAMPGAPLFTIYQPGALRVTASVPQLHRAALGNIKAARVVFPELGRSVEATSMQVLPTLDPATHVAQVRVGLPALPELTPGMAARVHFVTGQAEKLSVPAAAVLRRGEVAAVYLLAADGRLTLRQLRLGEVLADGEIEVLAGLTAGDRVVTDPVRAAIQLKSGK